MRLFQDNLGREWKIELNITTLNILDERVKAYIDKDFDIYDAGSVMEKMKNLRFAANLLFLSCKDSADDRGISDEDFGRALAGESMRNVMDAFVEEYINFFPDPTVQETLRTVVSKESEGRKRLQKAIEANLELMIQNAEKGLANIMRKEFSPPSPPLTSPAANDERSGNSKK